MPHAVYFDCDNTMGVPGCDLDDGLALLYLLGDDIALHAVTTSFGNSTIERVHANTERMFRELHLEHIPLKKGAASPEQRESEASHYLTTSLLRHRQPVKLLITGSPTNIYAACQANEEILSVIDELIFMGGVTEPLIIGGKRMDELNLASDPEAAHYLLKAPVKKTVLSAQICLQAFFDRQHMEDVLNNQDYPAFAYMKAALQLWYDFISRKYGVPGFHVWDIVAATYITTPELFDQRDVHLCSTVEDLKTGFLRLDSRDTPYPVNLPTTLQPLEDFWHIVFDAWKNVTI
ncbi:hypothetical protein GF339_21285 [candidate division KSB3 bacterium]|uniref:Inosine/uridine-preferring nucleoside hydrolase domain-containing protein n=1 Tax=candidate division KSB3 bacterium TaxID=2044937 RepID=A0A9D5Q7Q5_9BACT|nr:hypothetical protein [candidate division KSB3 bacterium]MBD3327135.1 hypothetical protein [candidate division KSB3 bacterium]